MPFTKKPWLVLILATFQCLSPLSDMLLNAYIYKMSPWKFFMMDIHSQPWTKSLLLYAIGPVVGFAIYRVRSWSYPLIFGFVGWVGATNFLAWKANPHLVGVSTLAVCYTLNLLLISYFMVPRVMKMYFNPRMRWWEPKPRYTVKMPSAVEASTVKADGTLVNISESGAMVETSAQLTANDPVVLSFDWNSTRCTVQGEVVYKKPLSAESSLTNSYGVRFRPTSEQRKQLSAAIKDFDASTVERRPVRENKLEDFVSWVKAGPTKENLLR